MSDSLNQYGVHVEITGEEHLLDVQTLEHYAGEILRLQQELRDVEERLTVARARHRIARIELFRRLRHAWPEIGGTTPGVHVGYRRINDRCYYVRVHDMSRDVAATDPDSEQEG